MSGSEALFQAPVLSTMMFDSLDMEGYKRALTVSMERGAMRVSRRRRSDWTSYPICTQEEYELDRELHGWQIEFPALGALRLHREIFRKAGDVPLLDFPVSASQCEPLVESKHPPHQKNAWSWYIRNALADEVHTTVT